MTEDRATLSAVIPIPGPATAGRAAPVPAGIVRRWSVRLLKVLLFLVIFSAAMEGGVLLIWGEQPKLPRHVVRAPWGLRYNEPNARYRHKSAYGTWYFRINGQGMRADRDYAYQRTPGVRRVVCIGDSFTIGYEVDVEQTFSAVLERELKAAGLPAEVLNCGMSGRGSAEELLYLERELFKYQPDVVVVAFYGNDLADNVRSALFKLDNGRLVDWNPEYVPGGRLANFLNTNPVFNFLNERSDAFSFFNFRLTQFIKRVMVQQNTDDLAPPAASTAAASQDEVDRIIHGPPEQQELAAAIYERMYQSCRVKKTPLVILSIPNQFVTHHEPLYDQFPLSRFDTHRPGLYYLPAKEFLDPYVATTELYYTDRTGHWTPFSHEKSGQALAAVMIGNGLLN